MEHNHNPSYGHAQPASLKNLVFAMEINGGIVAFEMGLRFDDQEQGADLGRCP